MRFTWYLATSAPEILLQESETLQRHFEQISTTSSTTADTAKNPCDLKALRTEESPVFMVIYGLYLVADTGLCLMEEDANGGETIASFTALTDWIAEAARGSMLIFSGALEGEGGVEENHCSQCMALAKKQGVDLIFAISSSTSSLPSKVRPKVSVFGELLLKAFSGKAEALDQQKLTSHSLIQFVQNVWQGLIVTFSPTSTLILDLNQPILQPSLGDFPLAGFAFHELTPMRAKEILTAIKNWSMYSDQQIEYSVNKAMHPHMEEEAGKLLACLGKELGFLPTEMGYDEAMVFFPDGALTFAYKALDKKQGDLVKTLELEKGWVERAAQVNSLLEALSLRPEVVDLLFKSLLEPLSLIPALQAKGYEVISQLEDKVILRLTDENNRKNNLELEIYPDKLSFLDPKAIEIFTEEQGQGEMRVLSDIFG